jgi:hypothetical protein
MVLQAHFVLPGPDLFFRQVIITGSKGIHAFDQIKQGADGTHLSVGPKILRSVLDAPSGREYSGKALIFDTEPGIGLVIPQQHIIPGLMFLDQVILQQKGIRFGGYHYVTDAVDLSDHDTGLPLPMELCEIRTNALFEILGLAYIEDFSFCIKKLINSRAIRKGF